MRDVVDAQGGVDTERDPVHGADSAVVEAEVGLEHEGMHGAILLHLCNGWYP